MRAITEATADVLNYGCNPRATPALRKDNVAEEKRRHGQPHQEHSDYALTVSETGATREGPDREAGHERRHSRDPPLDPVSAFEKISSHPHEAHEERADSCHQEQIADQHDVVYRLYCRAHAVLLA